METDDLNQEDLPNKPVSDTSENRQPQGSLSPTTSRRVLSAEELKNFANKTTDRMLKSLHESSGDE